MADLADEAQALEEAERDRLLAEAAARRPCGPGLQVCEGCGEPIEPARRAALPSARRCLDCATDEERATRRPDRPRRWT